MAATGAYVERSRRAGGDDKRDFVVADCEVAHDVGCSASGTRFDDNHADVVVVAAVAAAVTNRRCLLLGS